MSDKYFKIFIIVSFLVHGAIFAKLPTLNFPTFKTPFQKIEINYQNITPIIKEDRIKASELKKIKPKAKNKKMDLPDRAMKTPPQFKDLKVKLRLPEELIRKPRLAEHSPIIAGVKKITFPEIKDRISITDRADLPKNPVYLKYYHSIREKIRRYAYYNYNRATTGEAYLSFIVSSDGSLKALQVIDAKSTPSDYLKEIAVRSIKDAAPFARIPKELDFPELSFNVIIAFELD